MIFGGINYKQVKLIILLCLIFLAIYGISLPSIASAVTPTIDGVIGSDWDGAVETPVTFYQDYPGSGTISGKLYFTYDANKLYVGIVLASVTSGTVSIKLDDEGDGYSIYTKDGSRSAHFEHSVAVTKDGPLILTKE